jgi:hypothetical protein
LLCTLAPMMPVKPRSAPVTRIGVASLTIGASCLGPLTGEASCGRMETVANAAAPDTAMRRPTTADLFLMAIAPFQN